MKLNIAFIFNFISTLFRLPISYFDVKLTGDIMERIDDLDDIEEYISSDSVLVVFSLFTIIGYSIFLLTYSINIFIFFMLCTAINILWVFLFLNQRKKIDYEKFEIRSKESSVVIEIINGMQELKLQSAIDFKRGDWLETKQSFYKVLIKSLKVEQLQLSVASIINEIKKISILFLASYYIIEGTLSIGVLLAISFILGQLEYPTLKFLETINQFQDIKLRFQRIFEIDSYGAEPSGVKLEHIQMSSLPIKLSNLSFKYKGSSSLLFDDLSLEIEPQKTLAIVGESGSGKTTLLKLLLRYYDAYEGTISFGNTELREIDPTFLRKQFGVVMQDGYIFNSTIKENIILEEPFDLDSFNNAIRTANLNKVINHLPLGANTVIGNEGRSLSKGEKQRILIARAVYRNPEIILFDEATSALDARNESEIVNNLTEFLKGKTVIIIAHRLSTVVNADKIIVLENGRIIEQGNHMELVNSEGYYYSLVKSQLAY